MKWKLPVIVLSSALILTACGNDGDEDQGPAEMGTDEATEQSEEEKSNSDESASTDGSKKDDDKEKDKDTDDKEKDKDTNDEEKDEAESKAESKDDASDDDAEQGEAVSEAAQEEADRENAELSLINGKFGDADSLNTASNGKYEIESNMTQEEMDARMLEIEEENKEMLPSQTTRGDAKEALGIAETRSPFQNIHEMVRTSGVKNVDDYADDDIKNRAVEQLRAASDAAMALADTEMLSAEAADGQKQLADDYFFGDPNGVGQWIAVHNYGWSYGSDDVLVTHLGDNSYNWQIDFYDDTGDYMATAVGRYYAINEDVSQLDILNIVYTNNGTNQAVDKAEEDYAKYEN